MFTSHQSRHFFVKGMIKVLLTVCTLNCRVKNFLLAKKKVRIEETRVLFLLIKYDFGAAEVICFASHFDCCCFQSYFSFWRRELHFRWKPQFLLFKKRKKQFSLHNCWAFSFSKVLPWLRRKQKLADISRETQENARNSQSQNTFVRGITEEYIAQVPEEIEGRLTQKLSQECSRT